MAHGDGRRADGAADAGVPAGAVTPAVADPADAGRRDHHAELQGCRPEPDHPGGQRGDRQEFHHRSARQRQGDHVVGDPDVGGGVLRSVPVGAAGIRLCGGARGQSHQDHSQHRRPAIAVHRSAERGELELGRNRHPDHHHEEHQCRAAGAAAAALDSATGASGRLSERQHVDHLGSRQQRQPHHEDRRTHG